MGHQCLVVFQPAGLIQIETSLVERLQLVELCVPQPQLPVHHLANIAAKPDRLAADDGLPGDLLDQVDLDVQVLDHVAADDVAEVFHRVGLAKGVARVVNQADVLIQRNGDVLRGELLRGHLLITVEVPVPIGPLPGEAIRRGSQVNAEDAVNIGQYLFLLLLDLIGSSAAGVQHPQGASALAQFRQQDLIHPPGGGRRLGLRHECEWDQPVLVDQVDEHVPLPAIIQWPVEQEANGTVVDIAACVLDDRFQEIV